MSELVVVMEDFEGYASDAELAKAWYKAPHGNATGQVREPEFKNGGRYSLKFSCRNSPEEGMHYAAICRVHKWDLTGCNAISFWLKPDGSGRPLNTQINIASAKGRNIHDLWDYVIVPEVGDDSPGPRDSPSINSSTMFATRTPRMRSARTSSRRMSSKSPSTSGRDAARRAREPTILMTSAG